MSTPRQDRATATRARLIEAAYACLLDGGYAATTVGAVQQRAGVARGTLLHHFPTRATLMAAVVDDIAERRMRVLGSGTEPAAGGWDGVVDLVWRDLQSPAFSAALELWVASRTDPDLRAALAPVQQRVITAARRAIIERVGDGDPRVPTLAQFTIDLLTGTALSRVVDPDAEVTVVVQRWKQTLALLSGGVRDSPAHPEPLPGHPAPRLP
ncbi:TetR/AcrR family transcriptional regulator [Amycolatopsis sp. 195334CR]|uniref:TetR/AcrR family transcriptional regulator n=1 Tax=Amycolatopsis sp. 195334CR TaxID=2814588 RepID=UPI001A8FE615|nr:TetR/AcrR family transcriptional regulator [Amycolatopsis sp. 195334CR]MBN6042171.1 TetR/AcrR family transcriptional regulator [Amycolatopsis sp. 195334CR]